MDKFRARWLLGCLIVAHVVLHAIAIGVMFVVRHPSGKPIDVFLFALFMLGPSQGALLAIWIALGRTKFLWRVLPAALGAIVYSSFIGTHLESGFFIMGELVVCTVILLVARLTGLRLTIPSDSIKVSRPSQFYIRDMLVWMTALAVFLSLWQCLQPDSREFQHWSISGVALVSLTIIASVSIFSTLGRGWIIVRIASLPLAMGVAVQYLVWTHASPPKSWFFAMLLGFMALWIVGSLLVVRFVGYRLVWHPELCLHPPTIPRPQPLSP